MKLLQINSVYEISSTGRTSYELEKYLETKDWECHMAYADGTYKEHHGIRLGTLNTHRVHSGLARIFGLQGFFSPFSTMKLLSYIRKIKPDIIHLRNLHSNYVSFLPLLRYIAKKRIPTVITLHDFWFFTGGCCFPIDYECEKWKTQCEHCAENKKYALLDLSKFVFKTKIKLLNDIPKLSVVGVSNWACNECSVMDSKANMIKKTIYNWIDFEKFYLRNVSKQELLPQGVANKFIILGVATTWNHIKGLNDFLALAKKVDIDVHIVLIGRMPEGIQLPENISNIPQVTDVDLLAQYYSVADVFVNMSYRETFGKTMAEAMSCGCPVVAYDVTACKEIVGQHCGELVRAGNVLGVYEAIHRIRQNTKMAYYKECVKHTRELFDYKTNAEMYNQLYRTLLEEGVECEE